MIETLKKQALPMILVLILLFCALAFKKQIGMLKATGYSDSQALQIINGVWIDKKKH